jgi:hypothetical protein
MPAPPTERLAELRVALKALVELARTYAHHAENTGSIVTATKFHEIARKLEPLVSWLAPLALV